MSKRAFVKRVAVTAMLAFPAIGLAEDRLSVAISQSLEDAKAGRPYVTVSIKNVSEAPLWILPAHTPFALDEGHASGRWFDFQGEGGQIPSFTGRQLLIRNPSPATYDRLDPGEVRTGGVDLSVDYRFPSDGAYRVRTSIASYAEPPKGDDDDGGIQVTQGDFVSLNVSIAFARLTARLADSVIPLTTSFRYRAAPWCWPPCTDRFA